ncbi:MAG TPA: response regulator [Solirubrobacteraceae bacterium]|nr:response regulator [Solirubrobacteraceae bacterium]
MDRPRMLVCEDAIGYRMLIRRWLEDAGVEVVGEAPTWPEAERLAAELQPDAVIADLWMPTLDVDALTRLRDVAPAAAIVSLSGLSVEESRRLVGDTGAVDLFLSKRQPPADIVEALSSFVDARLRAQRSP